jgi:hypothetical protein
MEKKSEGSGEVAVPGRRFDERLKKVGTLSQTGINPPRFSMALKVARAF